MKGIINKITSTLFAALFVVMGCAGLILGGVMSLEKGASAAQVVASAATDEYKSYPRYNGDFEFGESTNVSFAGYPDKNQTIEFNLVITKPDKFKLGSSEYAKFDFVVVRTANGKDVPIYTLRIFTKQTEIYIGHKFVETKGETMDDLSILPGAIELVPDQLTGEGVKETKKSDVSSSYWNARQNELNEKTDEGNGDSFILDKIISNVSGKPFLTHTNGNDAGKYKGYQMLDLKLKVNSNYSEYYVALSNGFKREKTGQKEEWDFWPFTKKTVTYKYFEWEYNQVKSPTWSVSSALEQMEDEGRLTAANLGVNSTTFETVAGIAGTPEKRTITVEYLEQIGKSPFAAKKKVKVAVPMTDGKPVYDDICSAMGNKSLKCLGATVAGFEKDTFDVYTAQYESSYHFSALNEEGMDYEIYIELNRTYQEYIEDLEATGVFEEGMFSFVLNDLRLKYPDLESYEANEIYGLWGYLVVPATVSWNDLFSKILSVDTKVGGTIVHYQADGRIPMYEQVQSLKQDFGYTWLESIWESIKTFFVDHDTIIDGAPANHYIFVGNPKVASGSVDESGGAEGDTGAMLGNKIGDAWDSLTESIKELFQKEDSKDKTLRSILVLSGVVTVAGAAVAIAYLWYKKK